MNEQEAVDKLIAAKDAYRDKPTDANKAKLAAAKQSVVEVRQQVRANRGGAVPTVTAKTRSN